MITDYLATFDISRHPMRLSLIEKLKGKTGWLTLNKLTVKALKKTNICFLTPLIGDPDVSLSSFVISVTTFGQLGLWDKKLTQADFENHHVLFQDDKDKYIDKIMKAVLKR